MTAHQGEAGLEAVASEGLIEGNDPFGLFEAWLAAAEGSEPNNANAMTLATVDAQGVPDARVVLLKAVEDGQFVFYTNTLSAKGAQMKTAPHAALCFYWKTNGRQVRIRGPVAQVSDAVADAYFATRPRGSQIGAWASQQSTPLETRQQLIDAVATVEAEHEGAAIPRPPHWSGYAVTPMSIEFWQDQPFRLHDRLVFSRHGATSSWQQHRVYP